MTLRKSIGDGLYQDPRGNYWARFSCNGKRSWKKLAASSKREASKARDLYLGIVASEETVNNWIRYGMEDKRRGFEYMPKCLQKFGTKVKLVEVPPKHAGIYFLMKGQECVYVGQSRTDVYGRSMSHQWDKLFERIFILEIDATRENIDAIEMEYIRLLRPRLNTKGLKIVSSTAKVVDSGSGLCTENIDSISRNPNDKVLKFNESWCVRQDLNLQPSDPKAT